MLISCDEEETVEILWDLKQRFETKEHDANTKRNDFHLNTT